MGPISGGSSQKEEPSVAPMVSRFYHKWLDAISRSMHMLVNESPSHSYCKRVVVTQKRDAVLVHERERRFSFGR
jgi:hypothetical protein